MAKKKQVNSKKSKGSKNTPSKAKSKKIVAKKKPVKKAATKKTTAKKTAVKKTTTKKTVAKKAPVKKAATKKLAQKKVKLQYSVGDFIVYPSHGVGEITAIQTFEIAEEKLEMYNVIFDKEKMTLKIPTIKAKEIGIRKVSSRNEMKKTLEILKSKAKIRRTMWSRRAQEYEAKINSGILTELTEVVRDLFRNSNQPEQSYSERQLYESARDRLAREVAVVEKTDDIKAVEKIEIILNDATRKTSSENSII
ncbi:MAG: CarD family transcriptional regulator [Pseudomonadota bacterium]|nr:CarD family transcriptional regulator [Pseudomonadota bacterium]MED5253698.1 CarD family transcriptional regulator [Pseudomonadota bacterium]MED5272529.1 CarD family transcriptional regulator [Pseudomonadota bacterium]MED5484572.1 CarD family transcriptional regulator [Pseudomonadota bacterium]